MWSCLKLKIYVLLLRYYVPNNQLAEIEKEVAIEHEIGNVLANLEQKNMGVWFFKMLKVIPFLCWAEY